MDIKKLKPTKGRFRQGYINPSSCKKLFPQLKNDKIIYRSSYEYKFIIWLENNNNVRYWGSECFYIPYKLYDGCFHKYYPDYFVEMINGDKYVIEIKPLSHTQKPISENSFLFREYIKNTCKWRAMKEFCDTKGYKFKILTEKSINSL